MADPFDICNFIIRKAELIHVWGSMESALESYKGDKTDLQTRIDIIKQHYSFLNELQMEYETMRRVNRDYINQNLSLLSENNTLKQQLKF